MNLFSVTQYPNTMSVIVYAYISVMFINNQLTFNSKSGSQRELMPVKIR